MTFRKVAYRALIAGAAVIGLLVCPASAGRAGEDVPDRLTLEMDCRPLDIGRELLLELGYSLRATGLDRDGDVVELWGGSGSRWRLVYAMPAPGLRCLIASGVRLAPSHRPPRPRRPELAA